MTTYYISPNGSDSNNGLGPDASHASNKPYLTLAKATNGSSAVVPGDIVYIAPGYYYSTSGTVASGICSVASPTQFIGDPTNAQGFKDSGGVRLAPGLPYITGRASGDGLDGEPSTGGDIFDLYSAGVKGLQFKKLVVEAGRMGASSAFVFSMNLATTSDILFEDCRLVSSFVICGTYGGAPTAGRNITLRRCLMICRALFNIDSAANAATADADLNIVTEESFIIGDWWYGNMGFSNGGNKAGGLYFYNNFLISLSDYPSTRANLVSTTKPVVFSGNIYCGSSPCFSAGTAGQISDAGYNRLFSLTNNNPYTNVTKNVTSGTESKVGVMPLLVLPDLVKFGLEMPRSDMFSWADAMPTTARFTSQSRPNSDFRGRTVRPWGAGASIGCWQAQDVVQDTSSAITGGGANSLKLTGAGEVSLYIPVDATGFTVSVRTKSTSYGGAN